MNDDRNTVRWQNVKNQFVAAIIINLATVTFGLFEGWINTNMSLLTSTESPLPSGSLSMEQISWIASIQCIGALFGNIVFGYIINRYGRRLPMIVAAAPMVVCWLAIGFAQNVYYLYIARFVGGFFCCGGIYTIVPLFLTEIANDNIRGVITATHVLSGCIGGIIAYIFGSFLDYKALPILVIVITITYAILVCLFLHETPLFLVMLGKIDTAKKSIQFYQNIHHMSHKSLEIEIDRLRSIIDDIHTKCDGNSFDWSELKTKIAQRAILIGIVLMILNQFSGVVAMMAYSGKIFEAANSALPPNLSIICTGVVQLISNIITVNLVDRAGRRLMISVSATGIALGQTVLGLYMMLKSWNVDVSAFTWIPLGSFSFVLFLSQVGVLSLPFVVLAEIMPQKIKDGSVSFCMSLLWLLSFISRKYLPLLIDLIDFHGCMFLFAGISVCGAIFIISYMPETKCRTHEEIMKSLE